MNPVYKLLRCQPKSIQFASFFLANLTGMLIVLLSVQIWLDLQPFFTGKDRVLRKEFLVVTKRVSALGTFVGRSTVFTPEELREISGQPFARKTGSFTSSRFRTTAGMEWGQFGGGFATELFFESVPDEYIDVKTDEWDFQEGEARIPIILPRNYLNLYNFGFAQSRNLPKLSEGTIGLLNLDVRIQGNGRQREFQGKIVGFSNRLNTILVPQRFMDWANAAFAGEKPAEVSRVIVETDNPADERIARFFKSKGYEIEGGRLAFGEMAWFLNVFTAVVAGIGLLICFLSFYILILSIYLLVQKDRVKIENLVLLGYAPGKIARPYELFVLAVQLGVVVCVWGLILGIRGWYLPLLREINPAGSGMGAVWIGGMALFAGVFLLNAGIIRRKIRKTASSGQTLLSDG